METTKTTRPEFSVTLPADKISIKRKEKNGKIERVIEFPTETGKTMPLGFVFDVVDKDGNKLLFTHIPNKKPGEDGVVAIAEGPPSEKMNTFDLVEYASENMQDVYNEGNPLPKWDTMTEEEATKIFKHIQLNFQNPNLSLPIEVILFNRLINEEVTIIETLQAGVVKKITRVRQDETAELPGFVASTILASSIYTSNRKAYAVARIKLHESLNKFTFRPNDTEEVEAIHTLSENDYMDRFIASNQTDSKYADMYKVDAISRIVAEEFDS